MASTKTKWIIGGAVLVGILLLIGDRDVTTGGIDRPGVPSGDGGSGPCMVTVTADSLNVRSSPDGAADVVETFDKGDQVSADRTTQNGFRQLSPDRWAADDFLEPTPGSDCG